MPSLFRRKSTDLSPAADDAAAGTGTATTDGGDESGVETASTTVRTRPRSYTPSKREQGKATPKRREAVRRNVEPPPANRREALKRQRAKMREERAEARRGMLAGDERYLPARDKGPERALVRDIVDSRRTLGTWFFGLTFVVMLIGFNQSLAPSVYFAANMLFLLFAVGTAVDSFMITRTVKRLITQRHPKTEQRLRSLYFYAVMRGISFRFIRNPKPRVKIGEQI